MKTYLKNPDTEIMIISTDIPSNMKGKIDPDYTRFQVLDELNHVHAFCQSVTSALMCADGLIAHKYRGVYILDDFTNKVLQSGGTWL